MELDAPGWAVIGYFRAPRNIKAAIERVASRLGSNPTICRKCDLHQAILETYLDGDLALEMEARTGTRLTQEMKTLQPEEAAVLALLLERLRRERSNPRGA